MKDSTRTLRLALAASALLLGAPLQAETQSVPPLPADDLLLETDSAADNGRASEARGVLRAAREALLSSELAGRITEIPHAEGETFAKGAVLVRFDCSAYQAQRQAAEAAARAAREELGNKRQLASLNSVGRFEVSLAEARQAQAQAEARVYQVQVQRCEVHAPFAGQVVSRRARPHESVATGTALLEIVDNSSLQIHVLVPSHWQPRLQPGQTFSFIPDETGVALPATIKRLGARIDEGSQTLLLIGELPTPLPTQLLAGMSGRAVFAEQP